MKYVTVLFDGMADHPDENGQTPMSVAKKPTVDALAKTAEVGLCLTVPDGFKPGSDVANLAVMGYDPHECYTGRSPLEAISMGVKMGDGDVTYRANLVTLSNDDGYENKTMLDYSAGEVTTAEATELIRFLDERLGIPSLKLFAGVSYRHCLRRTDGKTGASLTPPHDISDRKITEHLPKGMYADELCGIMKRSYELLESHPINVARVARGLKPANSLWLWGEGRKPKLRDFFRKTGLRGAVISAVDLVKGIAIGAGLDSIDVDGATGNLHTNFDGKAAAAIDALKTHDYVYVHLEAPDECGHQGDRAGKTRAIELIDGKIVTPIYRYLSSCGEDFAILVMPDHATPCALKTHTSEPIPYLLYRSDRPQKGCDSFCEKSAAATGNFMEHGYEMLDKLLGKKQ